MKKRLLLMAGLTSLCLTLATAGTIQDTYLKASNAGGGSGLFITGDYFGSAVAISGNVIAVGAPRERSNATGTGGNQADNSSADAGAAYVFTGSPGSWSQAAYLKPSNTRQAFLFGTAVAASGNLVAVGAPGETSGATGINGNQNDTSASGAGAVYVFNGSGGAWLQEVYLKASNTSPLDNFGFSIAISGDTIVVGAPGEDSNATGVNGNQSDESAAASGAAYVFVRSIGGAWSQQAYLKASNTGASDRFGEAVAIDGNTIVVGASQEDTLARGVNGNQNDNNAVNSGAAYVFTRTGTVWSQQAYLKSPRTSRGIGGQFGRAVSVAGDSVLVGEPSEQYDASGVNGPGTGEILFQGAAHLFQRTAGVWSAEAYFKPSFPSTILLFGEAVALSGNLAVVGGSGEDSAATGIDGNQSATATTNNSGAVWLFVRDGNVWTQRSYLKASNAQEGDLFGIAVAISGTTLLVGAQREDSSNGNQDNETALDAGAAYTFVTSAANGPDLALERSANSTLSDGALQSFGTLPVGGQKTITFTLRNTGNAALTGIAANLTGTDASQFAVNTAPAALLTPGGTTTVAVRCAPTSTGVKQAKLTLASNDPDENPFDLTLTANMAASFDPASVDTTGLAWITGGTGPWQAQTLSTHDGVDAAISSSAVNSLGKDSWLETAVTGPGTLSFWWKVSCSFNSDFLRLMVDAADLEEVPAITGTVDWTFVSAALPAGEHWLRWRYSKGGTPPAGLNQASLDQVVWAPGAGDPTVRITSPTLIGSTFSFDFSGPPGQTGWQIKGSATLPVFSINLTASSTITEGPSGNYHTAVNVGGQPAVLFLRVEEP